MTTNDPFDDPRVQGVISALCRALGREPSEFIVAYRGEHRGGVGGLDTTADPSSPASGDREQE